MVSYLTEVASGAVLGPVTRCAVSTPPGGLLAAAAGGGVTAAVVVVAAAAAAAAAAGVRMMVAFRLVLKSPNWGFAVDTLHVCGTFCYWYVRMLLCLWH